MLTVENVEVVGWEPAIRGMRNPLNSWDKSDSTFDPEVVVGETDLDLMHRLSAGGPTHGKFKRMLVVYMDITAPLYWWKEADTYKVGTVANSCSTMHKIHSKKFSMSDFSTEHLTPEALELAQSTVKLLNSYRNSYKETKDKNDWWQLIQLLPSSYNQKRTVMLNYEVLSNIYHTRKDHKLDEWHTLCDVIKTLPHSELITE